MFPRWRPLVVPFARWHAGRAHVRPVAGVPLVVLPGVFDPELTKVGAWLAGVMAETVRPGERWLELGTGSGLVACAMARAGARVTATDLDPAAVRNARLNAAILGLPVEVREGDLFAAVADELRGDSAVAGSVTVVAPEASPRGAAGVWRPYSAVVANLPFWPGPTRDLPLGHAFSAGDDFVLLRRFAAEFPAYAPRALTVLSEAFAAFPQARAALGPHARLLRRSRFRGEWLDLFELTAADR